MHFKEVTFFIRNKEVLQTEALILQCRENDILQIRKKYQFKISWNGEIYGHTFYTNISYTSLLTDFLTKYNILCGNISRKDFYFDRVNERAIIPIGGVSNVLTLLYSGSLVFSLDLL